MGAAVPIGGLRGSWSTPPDDLCEIADRFHFPPLRNLAQFGVFEAVGEEAGDFGFQLRAGGAADLVVGPLWVLAANSGLGAHRVEVDEPALEDRPRHLLQRPVHPPV